MDILLLTALDARLNTINNHLLEIHQRLQKFEVIAPDPTIKKPLTVEEAAAFLSISKQTIYQNIDALPHEKRFGRLYFFEDELLVYLKRGSNNVQP